MVNIEFLRKIDVFGKTFNLFINGQSSFKTKMGGFLSILCYSSIVVMFIFLGKNFYNRENPNVSMSKVVLPNYFNYTLNGKNLIFGFRIEDQNSNIFHRPDLFYIEPHYLTYIKSPTGENIKLGDIILDYKRCVPEDTNNNSIYQKLGMYDYMCIENYNNLNLPVGGMWDGENISYIKIKLRHCSKGVEYNIKNNITCSKDENEFKIFDSKYIYFNMIIQNFFMDSENYENPFQTGHQVLYETIDMKVQKKIYYYFKKGIMLDKKGWFSDEPIETELCGVDRARFDSVTSSSDLISTNFYEANLYFDKIVETYNRRYMKGQEIIANIGGLIKGVFFFLQMIFFLYNKYYGYKYILNNCFFEDENIDHNNNINNLSNKDNVCISNNLLKNKIEISNPNKNFILNNDISRNNIEGNKIDGFISSKKIFKNISRNIQLQKNEEKSKLRTNSKFINKDLSKEKSNRNFNDVLCEPNKNLKINKNFDTNHNNHNKIPLSSYDNFSLYNDLNSNLRHVKGYNNKIKFSFLSYYFNLCTSKFSSKRNLKIDIYQNGVKYFKEKIDIKHVISIINYVEKNMIKHQSK